MHIRAAPKETPEPKDSLRPIVVKAGGSEPTQSRQLGPKAQYGGYSLGMRWDYLLSAL